MDRAIGAAYLFNPGRIGPQVCPARPCVQAMARTAQARARIVNGASGSVVRHRSRSAARPAGSSVATYAPAGPTPCVERVPPVVERGVGTVGDERHWLDLLQARIGEQLLQVPGARSRQVRFIADARVHLPRHAPEQAQRTEAAGVVPDARRDDPARARDPAHLADPADRVGHEMHHELRERGIERVVVERQVLCARLPDVDAGMAGPSGRDERLGWIDRRDARRPDTVHEVAGQGPRPAPHIEDPLPGSHVGEVGHLRRQEPGVSAHELVVGVGRDIEAHDTTLPDALRRRRFRRLPARDPLRCPPPGHPDRGPVRHPPRQDRDGRDPLRPRRDRRHPGFVDGRAEPPRVPAAVRHPVRRDARRGARPPDPAGLAAHRDRPDRRQAAARMAVDHPRRHRGRARHPLRAPPVPGRRPGVRLGGRRGGHADHRLPAFARPHGDDRRATAPPGQAGDPDGRHRLRDRQDVGRPRVGGRGPADRAAKP